MGSGLGKRRILSLVLVALLVSVVGLALVGTASAQSLPVNESFDSPNPANWDLYGNDSDSGESHVASSGVAVGPNGEPALELTQVDGNQAGTAIYTKNVSSTEGITATFRYYAANGSTPGADGISFFLLDESDISGGFDSSDIGNVGGPLGYGSDSGPGGPITGGFLAVGFDEWGNFDEPTYSESSGGEQEITIRGSTDSPTAPVVRTTALTSNTVDGGWRRVRITVDPTVGTSSDVNVSVFVDFEDDGTFTEVFAPATYDIGTEIDEDGGQLPSKFKLGFSGATGGSTNVHAVDGLNVTKPADLSVAVTDQPGTVTPNGPFEYTYNVSNSGPNGASVSVNSTLPLGDTGVTGVQWSYQTDTGDSDSGTNLDNVSFLLADGENATVTVTGTVGENATGDLNHTLEAVGENTQDPEVSTSVADIVTTDGVPPTVTVDEPTEGAVFSSSAVALNVSANEAISNWNYSINGASNQSFTPNTTLSGLSDGDQNLTVYAADTAGNTGSGAVNFSVDTTAPSIPAGNFTVTNPDAQNISVSFTSSEQLANISVSLSGAETTTLTEGAFSYDASSGTYTTLYQGSTDGTYNATLDTAEDAAGNDGASGQSDQVLADINAPNIPSDSFTLTYPGGQNVSVSFNSSETLANISVDLSGPEKTTLTEVNFTENNGTYTAVYDGKSDGTYTGTLLVAEDAAGNDGASGQSAVITVDTTLDTPAVAYQDPADDSLVLVTPDGNVTDTGEIVAAIGHVGDVDADGIIEVAAVDTNNNIDLLEPDGTRVEDIVNGPGSEAASSISSSLGVADYDDDGTLAVIYVDSNSQRIYREEIGTGENEEIYSSAATAVVDYGDFTGDGIKELVFTDSNQELSYLNDSGSETTISPNGIANQLDTQSVGQMTDYDGDGTNRIPVVDTNNDLAFINASGGTEILTADATSGVSLGAADVVDDGDPEAVYVDATDDQLTYLKLDGTSANLNDAGGNPIPAGNDAGVTGSATTGFEVDTAPPDVGIVEPTEGETLASAGIALSVTANESIPTWNYNVDGAANQSFSPNTTVSGLSDGDRTVTVYAEDTAGNIGTETVNFTIDTTVPTIPVSEFDVTNPEGQNVSVAFNSSEQLANISVSISGAETATLTDADYTYAASTGTYTAIYEGSSDGTYNATLDTAEDAAGNDGASGQSDETTVDTTAPTIPAGEFTLSEEPGQNVSVSFNSSEQLTNISVSIGGAETATLTEADFTEAGGTYTAVYDGSSDGTYNATLDTAEDASGNDGASSQSDDVTIDTTAPVVTLSKPVEGEAYDGPVPLNVSANEPISTWSYTVDGGTNQSFTPNTTVTGLSEGDRLVSVYATDSAGNTGSGNVNVTVDTTVPTVPGSEFEVTNPEGQNISVSFNSSEQLSTIGVSISGAETATLTEAAFSYDASTGTYTAIYEGGSDGTYNGTLTTAADAAGNDGASGQSDEATVDTTAPTIPAGEFSVTNPEGQNVSVSFNSSEPLVNISVSLSGAESATLTETDFSEAGGTYTTVYEGSSDGTYNATLDTAEDASGNDGASGQSDETTVDTTAPTIPASEFSVTNPEGQNVSVSFNSSEQLTNISVSLSGAESATLTEANFTEAGGTYTTVYEGSSDGTYNATLNTAEDSAGNDGATGQSDETVVDTTAPTIPASEFSVTNPEGQNVSVSFNSSEPLVNISVSISGPESATLTETAFTEDNGTYSATYQGSSDGTYNATLDTAEDASGNDGASGQSEETVVDTTAPAIPGSEFSVTNPEGQNVSVSFNSSEELTNISVSLSGPETATLTEADFTEAGGTYTAVYEGSSDGTYNATLDTAEDSAGNDGASGQSDETAVDTTAPTIPASEFSVTNPEGQNVSVSFNSSEPLVNISVLISGAESAALTEADFSEAGGTYTAVYEGSSDGTYNATLDTAEDADGNDGASGQSDEVTVDTTAPSISAGEFSVTNPEGQNVSVSFNSSEQLVNISVSFSGAESATLTEADFTEAGGTYTAVYEGSSDGTYNATLDTAEDAAGNDGASGQSDETVVDTTAPSISAGEFTVTNPGGQNVSVSFNSSEPLVNISVSLSGPESATLTEADFTEDGGTYTAVYESSSDGIYNATLDTAEDAAGNDGASGQSDETVVDTTAPSISAGEFTVTNPEGQNVSVSFNSSEELTNISVSLAGPETATLTESDFTEDGGTYTAIYEASSDGTYNATLDTAEDAAGNDGATGQSDKTTIDTTAPTIPVDSFTATNPEGQNVSVSFNSSETLANISVSLSGPETATLTEVEFTEDNGTYTATYDGSTSGIYTATLVTAEDADGNDGASGQSDTVSTGKQAVEANAEIQVNGATVSAILAGEDGDVLVNVQNTGELAASFDLTIAFEAPDGTTVGVFGTVQTSELGPGASEQITFSGVTGDLTVVGFYDVVISATKLGDQFTETDALAVSVDVNDNGEPADEVPGGPAEFDNMFANVDGTGPDRISIIDVLAMFENLPSDEIQDNEKFFEFNDPDNPNPDTINILDVVALFEKV